MCGKSTSGLGERPVPIRYDPRLWSPSLVVSERMMLRCLNCLATSGMVSVMDTPEADVLSGFGADSPPPFAWSGFMSHRSMVVGPPPIHSTIRLLFFFFSSAAFAVRLDRNDMPGTVTAAPAAACLRKCRRSVIPNMVWPCVWWGVVGEGSGVVV